MSDQSNSSYQLSSSESSLGSIGLTPFGSQAHYTPGGQPIRSTSNSSGEFSTSSLSTSSNLSSNLLTLSTLPSSTLQSSNQTLSSTLPSSSNQTLSSTLPSSNPSLSSTLPSIFSESRSGLDDSRIDLGLTNERRQNIRTILNDSNSYHIPIIPKQGRPEDQEQYKAKFEIPEWFTEEEDGEPLYPDPKPTFSNYQEEKDPLDPANAIPSFLRKGEFMKPKQYPSNIKMFDETVIENALPPERFKEVKVTNIDEWHVDDPIETEFEVDQSFLNGFDEYGVNGKGMIPKFNGGVKSWWSKIKGGCNPNTILMFAKLLAFIVCVITIICLILLVIQLWSNKSISSTVNKLKSEAGI